MFLLKMKGIKMSTRSCIAGMVNGCYHTRCHLDGYPGGVGYTLLYHYPNIDDIEPIIDLGHMIRLGVTSEECKSYHRDWGRSKEGPWFDGDTIEEAKKNLIEWVNHSDQEYIYFHNGDYWEIAEPDGTRHWTYSTNKPNKTKWKWSALKEHPEIIKLHPEG